MKQSFMQCISRKISGFLEQKDQKHTGEIEGHEQVVSTLNAKVTAPISAKPAPLARPVSASSAWRVPATLDLAAAYAWRLLIVGALVFFVWQTYIGLSSVTVPIVCAILLTAMLWPMVAWLVKHKVPRILACALALLLLILVVVCLFSVVSVRLFGQVAEIAQQTNYGVKELTEIAQNNPLGISQEYVDYITSKVQEWAGVILSSSASLVAGVGISVGQFFASAMLTLFATFFFLFQGPSLLSSLFGWMSTPALEQISTAGKRGWASLVSYVRAVMIVAAVNACITTTGAFFLGTDFFITIGCLTFLMAFIPLIGSFISGAVACLVVIVTLGWVKALIMLLIFVAMSQLEGNVLHPFLLGKAVQIHPLVILFGIVIGMMINGIAGALFIVPLLAFSTAFIKSLSPRSGLPSQANIKSDITDPEQVEKKSAAQSVHAEITAKTSLKKA